MGDNYDSVDEIRALEVMLGIAREENEHAMLNIRTLMTENKQLKVALADALMTRIRADEEC